MHRKNCIIPIFIPELACPFQCLYCDQHKISGAVKTPSDDEILQIMDTHLSTIPDNTHVEIAFFGGNFTGIPLPEQEHFLALVQGYLESGKVQSIRCSTRPDYINEEVLELLKKYGVQTIELGAQSMDDGVLKMAGRGHSVNDTMVASNLIRKFGFDLGLQMMVGLPGDTKEKSLNTAQKIVELSAKNTRIYPTLVIRGTKLEELYHKKKYIPLSLEEAVEWVSEILVVFEKTNVDILRVGLHPSEGLLDGSELVAGPFHPSFRELAYTKIWHKKLEQIEAQKGSITISVNPKELNYAIGYNGSNKKFLKEKFKRVKFISDESLKDRECSIEFSL